MNVLFVDQFGEIGGAQKCMLDLVDDWPDPGSLTAALPHGPLSRALRRLGVPTIGIPCGPYGLGRKTARDVLRFCADAPRQASILRAIIEQGAIDLVYVNGPRVLAGAMLAARGRCRVLFHAHNCLTRWHDRAVVRFALRRGASAIACCEHVARSIGQGIPVVENGVPDAGFERRQYPPALAWRVGIVGRIAPEKGHLALIDALRTLTGEGLRILLVVAGAAQFGSSDYESQVRRAAEGLSVRFTGWSDDIGSVFRGLDILAVPSAAEPGLPRVVLEAFSAGLPVIAAPTGGIPEAIHDGQTGFLAANSGAAALADRLRAVIHGSPADLSRVAARARSEWKHHWNVERWRREVLAAIRSAQGAPAHALRQSREESNRVAPEARP